MAKLYHESQKFNQWWIWAILLVTLLVGIGAGYFEYLGSGDINSFIIAWVVSALALILIAVLELCTVITTDGIKIGFWPFHTKKIFRSEIKSAQVRVYSPLSEYGGWGIRKSSAGTAYNVMGNHGLQLELTDGKRLLIGTQHPEELEELMRNYLTETDAEPLDLDNFRQRKEPNSHLAAKSTLDNGSRSVEYE